MIYNAHSKEEFQGDKTLWYRSRELIDLQLSDKLTSGNDTM